jgi:hypothetical protein
MIFQSSSARPGAVMLAFILLFLALTGARGEDLLAFRVKDRDFKPVEIPDWVYDNWKVGFADDEGQLDRAIRADIKIMHSGLGPAIYYPLQRDDPKSKPNDERAGKALHFVTKAKAHGMKVIFAGQSGAIKQLNIDHPDWLVHPTNDDAVEQAARANPEKHFARCLNSPWGAHYRECLGEIMRDFANDGFSFDGNYLGGICYCKYCKALYKADTAREIPAHADLQNVDYRVYVMWAGQKLEDWHRATHDRLREINPQCGMLSWTVCAGRYMQLINKQREMSQRANLLLDVPNMEWWLDEMHQGSTILSAFGPAYLRAVSGHRVAAAQPYLIAHSNPYDQSSFPPHEAIRMTLLAMTNGVQAPPYFGWNEKTMEEMTRQTGQRERWLLRAEEMPWAGMFFSDNNRLFYGLDQIADRVLAPAFGIFRVAYEEHMPMGILTEWDLHAETLARYRVLVLPNQACLSDDQAQMIREYVANGGGLVASLDTSRFDELGRERKDFALADVFGVNYQGVLQGTGSRGGLVLDENFAKGIDQNYFFQRANSATVGWTSARITTTTLGDDPRINEILPGHGGTCKAPMAKVSAPGGDMKLALEVTPDGLTTASTAVVMGNYGKGRVVYMATALDYGYYSYSYPYQRLLLAQAIRWAAREPFPIQVKAPMCVQSTFFTQKDKQGERVIVQFFNDINTTSNHGKMETEVPLREETVPVAGMQVRFDGMNIKRLHLEPEGGELSARSEEGVQVVDLPPLEMQYILVAERQ